MNRLIFSKKTLLLSIATGSFIILAILYFPFYSYQRDFPSAKKNELDSLIAFLNSSEFRNNTAKSVQVIKEAEKLAIDSDECILARIYHKKAILFQNLEKPDSALAYFMKSLELANSLNNDTLLGRIKNGLANMHLRAERYFESMNYLTEALGHAEKVSDLHTKGLIFNGIALVYISTNEFEKAVHYFNLALDVCHQEGDLMNAAGISMNIASCYSEIKQYDKALSALENLFGDFRHSGDTILIVNSLINMGTISREMGLFEKSHNYFRQAQMYSTNPGILSSIYVEQGILFYETGEDKKAESCFVKANKMASGAYALSNKMNSFRYLSLLEEKKPGKNKGLEYFHLYSALKDSIMSSETAKKIAEIHYKYDLQKKETENLRLNEKLEANRRQGILISILSFTFLLVALLVIIMIRLSNRNLNNSIRVKNLENQKLQDKMQAEEKIRALEKLHYQTELNARNAQLTATSLQLITKNELLNTISEKIDEYSSKGALKSESSLGLKKIVRENLSQNKDWEQFKKVFENVHKGFFSSLKKRFPDLSENELRLCAFIKSNLQTKEIASMLNINPSSVTVSRYRIRKKMNLDHETSLEDVLREENIPVSETSASNS